MNSLGSTPVRGFQSWPPELRFWVTPSDNLHYEVDLTEFATGGRADDSRIRRLSQWRGDFDGRPDFAAQFAAFFRMVAPPAYKENNFRSAMRCLFRFLQEFDPNGIVDNVGALNDVHGAQFRLWADVNGLSHHYRVVLHMVGRMRDLHGYTPLLWAGRRPDKPPLLEDVDQQSLRRLFHAFRHEARAVKAMFAEGESLANSGQDPRGMPAQSGAGAPGPGEPRNQAWLVRHLTGRRLPSRAEIRAQGAHTLHMPMLDGPLPSRLSYLAPGMSAHSFRASNVKLRWFHPSFQDTAVFLWLFLLATGWNLATCLSLDVSEEAAWVSEHPYKPEAKLLHGYKARAGQEVFAFSATRPEFHPYQIMQYMIARTVSLRETLRHQLDIEEKRNAAGASLAVEAKIERLRRAIRSPWLFRISNRNVDDVGVLGNHDVSRLNTIARTVAERAGLLDGHPTLSSMTTSVARDGWMAHAYEHSGFSVVMAQLAGQHTDARSLLHYLRRRRYRTHSERAMRRVQDAAFAEIEARRPLDATRLRMMVESGGVTPEQEQRLLDHRMRTRMGMGCLDPLHPPRSIEPDHRDGKLCRVQRCTGCQHGIVFRESLGPLSRRRAELLHLQRTLPFAVWAQSSFDGELRSLEMTLELFDQDEVRTETERWRARINSGEVAVHDTHPL